MKKSVVVANILDLKKDAFGLIEKRKRSGSGGVFTEAAEALAHHAPGTLVSSTLVTGTFGIKYFGNRYLWYQVLW